MLAKITKHCHQVPSLQASPVLSSWCRLFPPTSFCFLRPVCGVFPCWPGPQHVLLAEFTSLIILRETRCSLLSQ